MKNFNMSPPFSSPFTKKPSSAGSATAVARWGTAAARWGTAAARCAPLRARRGSPTWAAGCPPRCAGDAGSGWASVRRWAKMAKMDRWPRWTDGKICDFLYGEKIECFQRFHWYCWLLNDFSIFSITKRGMSSWSVYGWFPPIEDEWIWENIIPSMNRKRRYLKLKPPNLSKSHVDDK